MNNSNFIQLVTMEHYDRAATAEEKREIAEGFENSRNKTAELNAKYIAKISILEGENTVLRRLVRQYKKTSRVLLVEEGSVDTDELKAQGYEVIVYRQNSTPPTWLGSKKGR